MERESFEDNEIAELLNQNYIAIKVDREERPDIDSIYMRACQALIGQGGWPLTIIMTPEKKPFFAATYLPKNNQYGMMGLTDILPRIVELWNSDRKQIEESGNNLSEVLNQEKKHTEADLDKEIIAITRQCLINSFDDYWGGFSVAPKFPTPHIIYFLLRDYALNSNKVSLKMAEKTLMAMYQGGIYDHIGGGFARYSTDRKWLVPHFEKMLYDNALLARAYLEAYQITGKDLYARVAREIFAYTLRDMTSPEGGFYSAQDADSEGVEGKFYVWSPQEVKDLLGEEKGSYFCSIYGISEAGNFEGNSIPNLIKSKPDNKQWVLIDELREKMLQKRNERIHPHLDDKILTSWNGFMIASLAYGARTLGEIRYLQASSRAADFILDKLRRNDGRLLARYRDGEASYPGYALDYAGLIWGLLELYQAGFETKYLKTALELSKDLLRLFWDENKGGLFLYGSDAEQLITRPKEIYDGALPSDNSVSLFNFLRLSRLTGDPSFAERARLMTKAFAHEINWHPTAHTFFLMAVLSFQQAAKEIVIVGEREREDTKAMLNTINSRFLPGTLLLLRDPYEDQLTSIAPYITDITMIDGKATAYVCENFQCQQPVNNIEKLIKLL
jgi:uncharacterized protein YyaL (SSP411 family)